jgi:hypothetical protein
MSKLAFIVEGDTDATVVRALVERIAPPRTRLGFVRAGGKIGIYSASPSVAILQGKGYDHVFVIFDADTNDPTVVREQETRIVDMLRERGLTRGISVVPVVPTIEAWLLADVEEQPDSVANAKGRLRELQRTGRLPDSVERIAERLKLEQLRNRSPSFAAFAQMIEDACSAAGTH